MGSKVDDGQEWIHVMEHLSVNTDIDIVSVKAIGKPAE